MKALGGTSTKRAALKFALTLGSSQAAACIPRAFIAVHRDKAALMEGLLILAIRRCATLPMSETIPPRRVTVAGMIVEARLHHQIDGRIMKFISICDYSGILGCELSLPRIEGSAWRQYAIP